MNDLEYLKMFQSQPSMRPMVLAYFLERKYGIETLLKYAGSAEPYPIPDYSSWVVTHLVKKHKDAMVSYQPLMIDAFMSSKNQSVLRNLLGAMLLLPLEEYKESELFDVLINHLINHDNKVALQVNAIYKLIQYGVKYPELTDEICDAISLATAQNKQVSLRAACKKAEKKFKRTIQA